jgi:hypothetical protein
MKRTLFALLEEAGPEQVLDILMSLCEKYPYLAEDIEFIMQPKLIKNSQAYYNKLAKKAIDTNSWSKFPNKGVKGLEKMVEKIRFLETVGNHLEAAKLAKAVLDIIARCKRNYNSQNQEELAAIQDKLGRYNQSG